MVIATTYVHHCPDGCRDQGVLVVTRDEVTSDGAYFHTAPRCAWTRVALVLMASEFAHAEEAV